MEESGWSSKCRTFEDRGKSREDDQGKTYNEVIRDDLNERKASKDIAKDRNTWKCFMRNRPSHASMENIC